MKNIIPLILFALFFTGFFVLRHPVAIAADEKLPEHFELSLDTPIFPLKENSGLSTKVYPVDMLSHGVHFRIPRNYVESVLIDPRDKTLDFSLVVRYPDFVGVTGPIDDTIKQTPNNAKWNWGISHDIIWVASMQNLLAPKNSDVNQVVFDAEKKEPDVPAQYGLLKSMKRSYFAQDIYFIRPNANNAEGVVIFCNKGKDGLNICQVHIKVSDNLMLRYQFHNSLLPHWQEIHAKMTNLINSFIVK